MDKNSVELLSQQPNEYKYPDRVARFVVGLNQYAETSEPYNVHFWPDDSFDDFVKLLGIENLEGGRVIKIHHHGTSQVDGTSYDEDRHPGLEGTFNPEELFQRIGNVYASYLEFVNNFVAGFVAEIDEKTVVVLGFESDEQPGICDDCDEEWDTKESNRDYNCGHNIPDEYYYKHWAIVLGKADLHLDRIDWHMGQIDKQ